MITEDKLKTPVWGRSNNPEFASTRKTSNPPSSLSVTRRQRDHKGQIANPCLGRIQPNQSSYAPEKQAVPPRQTTSRNVVTTTCAGRKQAGCNRSMDVGGYVVVKALERKLARQIYHRHSHRIDQLQDCSVEILPTCPWAVLFHFGATRL